MQWWNDFVDWLYSVDGWRVLSTVVFPFAAIVVAGLVAALIGRGSTRRVIALTERDRRISAVTALITAARRASIWNTLSAPEQQHADHLRHEADTHIRLLPLSGTTLTADWAAHEIAEMKKNSVNFSFQAEQSLIDFRDKLVEWQARPSRAKKLFKTDLDTWAYESSATVQSLVQDQKDWAQQQVDATGPISTITDAALTEPATASATPASAPVVTPTPRAEPAAAPELVQAEVVQAEILHAEVVPDEEPAAPAAGAAPWPSFASFPTFGSRAAAEPSADTGETGLSREPATELPTPNPVSASTVRRRILPEPDDR